MAKNSPFPVPKKGKILVWAMENEDALIEMVQWVNKMKALQYSLVTPGGYNKAQAALVEGGDNIVFPFPLKFPNSYAVMTGTALRTALATGSITLPQLAGIVMAIEQDLIAVGIMPSA